MTAQNITLKNAADTDVVFHLRSIVADKAIYVAVGATIAENRRLEIQVKENGKTVRVVGKLSVPSASNCDGGCSTEAFTEIGSFDLSSVKVAPTTAQDEFLALFGSFIANQVVSDAYKTGVN